MRFFRRGLTGLFLMSVTAALLAVAAQIVMDAFAARQAQQNQVMPARERVFAVNVVTIEPGTVTPVMEAFGEVRARRTLELRAQVGGPVVELGAGFEEGGRVEAGGLLLRVDARNLEDARALAETDLAEAEAERLEAERAVEIARDDLASAEKQASLRAQAEARQRDLAARGVGTEAAVETAALAAAAADQAVLSRRTALANAEARLATAATQITRRQIALEEAERRLGETEIRAAFAGTLSGVTAIEGRVVTANEKIATLIDPDSLEVGFRVSVAQYARLIDANGGLIPAEVTARLAVSGVELAASGRIERESAEVGTGQTGRLIFARLDAAPGFRPGDFVTVEVREPALEGVTTLPATAVDARNTVLVLGEEDRLELAEVEVLRRQGDDVLVRARGLSGRSVVAERAPMLGAGIRVRPIVPDAGSGSGGSGSGAGAAAAEPETIALDPERRARLIAFVEGNQMMPADAKDRILKQLEAEEVSVQMVERLEGRMGG